MRVIIVSDTHMQHEELGVLRGDVLIHCGDSGFGFDHCDADVDRLDEWFGRQEFDRILYVAGNHDFAIEKRAEKPQRVFRNAAYLQDQSLHYRGIRFYGAPWVPELSQWAFHFDGDRTAKKVGIDPGGYGCTHYAHPTIECSRPQ